MDADRDLAIEGAAENGHQDVMNFLLWNQIEQWRTNPESLFGKALARVTQGLNLRESTMQPADVREKTFNEAKKIIVEKHDMLQNVKRCEGASLPELDARILQNFDAMNRIAIRDSEELKVCTIDQILRLSESFGIFSKQKQPSTVIESVKTILFSEQFHTVSGPFLGKVLISVATSGYPDCLAAIIDCSRFNEIPMDDLRFAFHRAAAFGYRQIVHDLLTRGIQIAESTRGQAVTIAAQNGHLQVIQELLLAGAQIPETYRCLAIKVAAENGHFQIVKELLSYDSQLSERNRGLAVIDAAENGQLQLVKELLAHDAQISEEDRGLAVMAAAEKGHLQVVKELLTHGARISEKNKDLALQAAAKNGHVEVVRELLIHGARLPQAYNSLPVKGAQHLQRIVKLR